MGTRQPASGLADAIFTRTQARVLGLLFGSPGRSFFATEIFERSGVGRGAVQRELARLVESGLVRVTRVGNQKHYQANAESPIFDELRSIVRKTSGLADPIREALEPVAPHIAVAVVFGSVAKGTDRAGSDVDVLLVADELRLEQLYEQLQPVERQIGRRIQPTVYTRRELDRRLEEGNAFLRKLVDGPTIHLIGDEDVLRGTP